VKESEVALKKKNKTNPEFEPRIAAARIGKWLERIVLPGNTCS